jgi:hypothetical protein
MLTGVPMDDWRGQPGPMTEAPSHFNLRSIGYQIAAPMFPQRSYSPTAIKLRFLAGIIYEAGLEQLDLADTIPQSKQRC